MASEIRVNQIQNRSGLGTVTFSDTGVIISGITTISDLRTSGGALTVGTGASISSPATNVLTLGTNNVERVRVNSSGNIGVGTNGPVATVDVVTNSTTEGLRVRGRTSDNIGSIYFYNNSATTSQGYIQARTAELRIDTDSSNPLTFYAGGSERVRVSAGGSLGVRESSPDLPLHVRGDNAYPASSGSVPRGFISVRAKSAGATHGLHIGVADVAPYGSWLQAQDANNLSTNYPLLLNPNGGSVGIGTNNPTTNLQINAASETTASLYVGATKKMAIQAQNSFGSIVYSYDNEPLIFSVASGTSFSERMRIDSSGRITTPYQPAFTAYLSTNYSYTGNGNRRVIPFDTVVTNIGSHFNTSTNRFVAPVAGTYFFTASLVCNSGSSNTYFSCEIFVNAAAVPGSLGWQNMGSGYQNQRNSLIVYLNVNDYVDVRMEKSANDTIASGNTFSGFTGTLLG